MTASEESLGHTALSAAGINRDEVTISGMEDCDAFSRAILRTKETQDTNLDQKTIEIEIVAKARKMIEDNPDIAAFLLECGNLPPYQAAIAAATNKPVFSILDGVNAW